MELRAAATVLDGLGSLFITLGSLSIAPGSLSVALSSLFAAPGFLSAAGLTSLDSELAAAASPLGGNLVRNCVEFCDFG